MALIICPECGKEISDKAKACVHCGYPIADNKPVNHTDESAHTLPQQSCSAPIVKTSDAFLLYSLENDYVNIECAGCGKVYKYNRSRAFREVSSSGCVSNAIIRCVNCGNNAAAHSRFIARKTVFTTPTPLETLRCPKCNSTLVSTGQRGFNIWTGFLGSSKTVNRCGKCGHSWKPKSW